MIDLTADDLELLSDALPAHVEYQLRGEPDVTPARWETVRALAAWLAAGPAPGARSWSRAEAGEWAEALDSLIYWVLSPEDCRHSGEVYDSDTGELPSECEDADILRGRFETLYLAAGRIAAATTRIQGRK